MTGMVITPYPRAERGITETAIDWLGLRSSVGRTDWILCYRVRMR